MLRFSTAANQDSSSVIKRLCVLRGGSGRRHRRVKHILRRYTLHVCSKQPASLAQHNTCLHVCIYLLVSSQLLCRFAPQQCACETADRVLVAASARIKLT